MTNVDLNKELSRRFWLRILYVGCSLILLVSGITMAFLGYANIIDFEITIGSELGARLSNAGPGIFMITISLLFAWLGASSFTIKQKSDGGFQAFGIRD
ncbi:MAG: hypothetical protein AAF768_04070 [Pseudomonadota bacterium]